MCERSSRVSGSIIANSSSIPRVNVCSLALMRGANVPQKQHAVILSNQERRSLNGEFRIARRSRVLICAVCVRRCIISPRQVMEPTPDRESISEYLAAVARRDIQDGYVCPGNDLDARFQTEVQQRTNCQP